MLLVGAGAHVLAQALPPAPTPAGPAALPAIPSTPLTMQQAVDLALVRNPNLLAAQQNLSPSRPRRFRPGCARIHTSR